MTGQVTQQDPEWDDQQRGWVLALLELEADTCPSCRQPLSESTDPASEGRYRMADATRCHACTALAEGSPRYQKAKHPQALMLSVERIPDGRR